MDVFDSPYYRLNKRLLILIGQWPQQSSIERNFFRIVTVVLVGSILTLELIRFAQLLDNFKGMIECMPGLAIHFRSVVKFFNSIVNATKLKKLTNHIKDDWTLRTGDADENILRAYAEQGRRLTVSYAIYIYFCLAVYLAMPLGHLFLYGIAPSNQSRDRVYLFQAEYFVDQDKKLFYIMIHVTITMVYGLNVHVAYDTMYAVFVQHACGIFATLGARLRRIGSIENDSKPKMYQGSVEYTDEAYNEIVACIKMHNVAMGLYQLIESTSCISLLFVVGPGMLSTVMTGFMGVTNLDKPAEVFRYIVILVGELIHLLFIFWQGQMLLEHSLNIFVNAYDVNWSKISPRAQKLLIMIMVRSWKPCNLSAGKIIDLSMENFAVALKTMMSYFTVLLSMQ